MKIPENDLTIPNLFSTIRTQLYNPILKLRTLKYWIWLCQNRTSSGYSPDVIMEHSLRYFFNQIKR